MIKVAIGMLRRFRMRQEKIRPDKGCALVIGNGPSAADDLLALGSLAGYDIWSVNGFALSDQFVALKPSNYVLADPAYWSRDNHQQLNKYVKSLFDRLSTKTKWPMAIHLPFKARGNPYLSEIVNPCISFRYYNNTTYIGNCFLLRHWAYRNEYAMPATQNVLIPSIFLAILANYQRVEILGADHSWHSDLKVVDSVLLLKDSHFYEESSTYKPFLKADGTVWTVAEIFATWALVHRQYRFLDEFAKSVGTRIVNRSTGSFIDAFESDAARRQLPPARQLSP